MCSRIQILPFLLIACLVSPLAAQTEEKSWSVRVAALDIIAGHDILWLRTGPGKKPVEIPLNTRIFSQPTDHKGPAALVFYPTASEATAEEPPPPLATAVLTSKSSLLVFSPAKNGKTYQSFVTSDDEFPFGSFRLVNFSKATVRAELGGKTLLLKPGAAGTSAVSNAQNAIPVRIVAMAKDTPARVIRQSSWSIVQTQRELVLLFPNPDSGLVRLRHFVDTKAEELPE
jgi:hypothetical protein